jgi:pyruvate dehydrogenase E2 component (dihydrolipoamide acetyltransferase)
MPTDVIMPQMGESIFEGTITKWLKKPGDKIQRDEPLFEISTDKVDAEIPAPTSGVLKEIKVQEGATVQVNTVVATIDEAGSAAAKAPEPAKAAAKTNGGAAATDGPSKAAAPPAPSPQAEGTSKAKQPPPTEAARPAAQAPPAGAAEFAQPQSREDADDHELIEFPGPGGKQIRTSPLVRKIAKENNIDLSRVQGTGMQGRITKDDVLSFLQRGAAATMPIAANVTRVSPQPAAASHAAPTATPTITPGPLQIPGDLVAMSPMRKKIAERMVESKRTAPHVHTVYEVDMTRIVRLRSRIRAEWEKRNGAKLTFSPFVARATVAAMQQHPIVNSSIEGDNIRYHANINLGIAVSLDWGLIVPVIKRAEELNFLGLQRAINDLADRARHKRLNPDDVTGGTFTITNPGSIGGLFGMPIIMQPQVAILGTGGIVKTPVVMTDEDGVDSIAIRSIMHVVLGYDHRIIDGATAGYFLGNLKKFLEEWSEDIG